MPGEPYIGLGQPMEDSWRLKLARARRHTAEIEFLLEPLSEVRPYRVVEHQMRRRKGKSGRWRYTLHSDVEVNPNLPVVLGDFLSNVRSALDHMAVSLAPARRRREASFPIFTVDPLVPDPRHLQASAARLRLWQHATEGMKPEALRLLWEAQAFNVAPPVHLADVGLLPDDHVLPLLSAFQNADKHRSLVTVVDALDLQTYRVLSLDGRVLVDDFEIASPNSLLTNGTEARISEERVVVEAAGGVVVAVRDTSSRPGRQAHRRLPELCHETLRVAESIANRIEALCAPT